jgi:putative hydrolase of the HAD superfamily
MIKNIIFDIGNVILSFNRDYLLKHFYDGEEYEFLKENLFRNWEMLDEDLMTLEEYEKQVRDSLPAHLQAPAMAVLNNWEYYMSYKKGIVDLIRELKSKGYKLYVLSNMTRHFIKREYKFPIFKEFDGIVYSAPIKMIKPNPEIFKYILEKFSLNPEECVFTDDMKENLAAAARFKIKTFHYQDNTDELRRFILSL